ncbi:hypothetical protein BKA67DRAFT_3238 [Truncatella angustata]|uniref:Uncharacterized protein n=1 Tax=Truncatella angustata TaxID=152316 RepID=A0A9P8UVU1_9PEZI|nr:uncharacterized protein BKA67DRAFT_3238 [Truncatella angustata]KAH6658986.1 hypothetical protein BKA67DRAFT_3238 [Truncatella angustata]
MMYVFFFTVALILARVLFVIIGSTMPHLMRLFASRHIASRRCQLTARASLNERFQHWQLAHSIHS